MEDVVQSKCGLCVTHTLHDAYSFIKSLQHRGREACGMFAFGKDRIDVIKWAGTVGRVDLFDLHKIFPASQYHTFGAHVRYATKGLENRILVDAHPHFIGGTVDDRGDHILIRGCDAVAIHNGQVNFPQANATSECDTKLLLKYYLEHGEKTLLRNIPGSYLLAIADSRRSDVIVMRDRYGIKPGCLGFRDGKHCVASEDIAFVESKTRLIEDLNPGSIYYLDDCGSYSKINVCSPDKKHCFFEWNYVANERSLINGVSVLKVRQELGRALAEEFNPSDVDIISFLPRCPEGAANAYSAAVNKEDIFDSLFYKLRGERAFQGTTGAERNHSIKSNLHLLPGARELIEGKTVLMIDDSTIRGNNSRHASELLKQAGARKIYLVNYTPKIGLIGEDGVARGCMFGVDMPPEDDFIVRTKDGRANRTDAGINRKMGIEVYYLSREGMYRAFERCGVGRESLCSFCIGGEYPFRDNK